MKVLELWRHYRRAVFFGSLFLAFFIGLLALGPFLNSPEYQWIRDESNKITILARLIDVEGMFLEKLITSTFPIFCVWSLVFFLYGAMNDIEAKLLNTISPALSYFTSTTGTLVSFCGGLIIGICAYGIKIKEFSLVIITVLVVGIILIFVGIFLKEAASPSLKGRQWLHKHAHKFGFACAIVAILIYIYGLIAGPIQLWNIVHDAYTQR